jgi:hypothetical protein
MKTEDAIQAVIDIGNRIREADALDERIKEMDQLFKEVDLEVYAEEIYRL